MKIKRFENLWTMGVILFAIILATLYVAKLIFPSFVVSVAQTPRIVEIGNIIDSNLALSVSFNSLTSLVSLFLLICASCQVRTLPKKLLYFAFISILFSHFIQMYVAEISFVYNLCLPLVFVLAHTFMVKNYDKTLVVSTCATFVINCFAQVVTLEIRDISTIVQYPNTATYSILIIDGYIWQVLLYFFFNNKKRKGD